MQRNSEPGPGDIIVDNTVLEVGDNFGETSSDYTPIPGGCFKRHLSHEQK
jgi:hypothetical protein